MKPEISLIIPIVERFDDLDQLIQTYQTELEKTKKKYEFLFIVDGQFHKAFENLVVLKEKYPHVRVIKFARNFWEAVALMVGFQHAKGDIIITLSAYFQTQPSGIQTALNALEEGADIVVSRRFPRKDSLLNRFQNKLFHLIVSRATGQHFHDMASGLRAMKREVALSLDLSGDLHRFIPILAFQKGFKVKEIDVPQHEEDTRMRVYGIGVYLRRLIDIFSLFFLVKFTRKPLRFFGLIGASLFSLGSLISIYLAASKLFGHSSLAGRPLLLLGIMLVVVGIQVASLGLIGELIIFTNAREIKEYNIEQILE